MFVVMRPDAIDASSLWQILLDGVKGEAAVWPSRVGRGAASDWGHQWFLAAVAPGWGADRTPGELDELGEGFPVVVGGR